MKNDDQERWWKKGENQLAEDDIIARSGQIGDSLRFTINTFPPLHYTPTTTISSLHLNRH